MSTKDDFQAFKDHMNPLGAQVRKNQEAAARQAATPAGRGQTASDAARARGKAPAAAPSSGKGANIGAVKDARLKAALSKPTNRAGRK